MRTRRKYIAWLSALVLGVTSFVLLRPDVAQAGDCDTINVPCHIDSSLWVPALSFVRFFWEVNRGLLLIARSIESLRYWLIVGEESILGSAFGVLTEHMWGPFYAVSALVVVVFLLSYLFQAFLETNWVNLKRAIKNGLFLALLLTVGSQALSATEMLRDGVGTMMSGVAQAVLAPSSPVKFYAAGDTFVAPTGSIYGPDDRTCGGMSTARPTEIMQLNDIAANFFFADARDIHCPSDASGLPIRSGSDISFTEIYIHDPRGENNANVRAEAFDLLAKGQQRVVLGLVLSGAAIVEQLLYAIFAVALAGTWFSLLLGLLFGLFAPMEEMATRPVQVMFSILKASWMASLGMGFIVALISQAAATGNELVTVGMGGLGGAAAVAFVKTAYGSVKMAAGTLSMVAGGAPAALAGAVGGIVKGAVMVGTAVATGGASLGASVPKLAEKAGEGESAGASTALSRRRSTAPTTTSQFATRSRRARSGHTPRPRMVSQTHWYDNPVAEPQGDALPSSAGKTTTSLSEEVPHAATNGTVARAHSAQPQQIKRVVGASARPPSLRRARVSAATTEAEAALQEEQVPVVTSPSVSPSASPNVPSPRATKPLSTARRTTPLDEKIEHDRVQGETPTTQELPVVRDERVMPAQARTVADRRLGDAVPRPATATPPSPSQDAGKATSVSQSAEAPKSTEAKPSTAPLQTEGNAQEQPKPAATPEAKSLKRRKHAPQRGPNVQERKAELRQAAIDAGALPPVPHITREVPVPVTSSAQQPQPLPPSQPPVQPATPSTNIRSAGGQPLPNRPNDAKQEAGHSGQGHSNARAQRGVTPAQRPELNNVPASVPAQPASQQTEQPPAKQQPVAQQATPVQSVKFDQLQPEAHAVLEQVASQQSRALGRTSADHVQRIDPNNLPPNVQEAINRLTAEQEQAARAAQVPVTPVQRLDPSNLPPQIQAALEHEVKPTKRVVPAIQVPAAAQSIQSPPQAQPSHSSRPGAQASTPDTQPRAGASKRKTFSLSRRKK